jgi:hypothetical protein
VSRRVADAARGAAAGKVVSNVTKNCSTDDGIAGGARLDAMAGATEQRRTNRNQRQQTQQQQAAGQQKASAYGNALTACLRIRAYSVH